MGKYEVRWQRIWDFTEEVEAETEEETCEKILEERKTQGSTVEILSVMPIDIEEVKQEAKKEKIESAEAHMRARKAEREIAAKAKSKHKARISKEKK